jgi:hypothetical protein
VRVGREDGCQEGDPARPDAGHSTARDPVRRVNAVSTRHALPTMRGGFNYPGTESPKLQGRDSARLSPVASSR